MFSCSIAVSASLILFLGNMQYANLHLKDIISHTLPGLYPNLMVRELLKSRVLFGLFLMTMYNSIDII